jgi:transcription antitermination factor NusG
MVEARIKLLILLGLQWRQPVRPKMSTDAFQWYALQVQSRLINAASAGLRGKGYEEFLPIYRSRRRWSDRFKEIDLPMFPGYLFCRFNPQDRLIPIFTTPGVMSIVGAGKTPISVSEDEIEAVRTVLRSGLTAQPWPYVRTGCKVSVERGPLAGLEGIVIDADKVDRLVVSVSLLQRSVAVDIHREWARFITTQVMPFANTAKGPIA